MTTSSSIALAWRWKRGRNSVHAKARAMLRAGGGLTEKQIEAFYASIDRIRERRMKAPSGLSEFQAALEATEQRIIALRGKDP